MSTPIAQQRVAAAPTNGEQVVLRQLHRKPRGRQRLSYAEIAAQLNAERLPTRTGTPWRAGTVRRILRRVTVS